MKKKSIIVIGIIGMIAILAGISYALWLQVFEQAKENSITSDCFQVTLEEDKKSKINIENGYPISEQEGMRLKPYRFTIKNECSSVAQYQVNIETMSNNTMPNQVIRAKLNEEKSVKLIEEVEKTVGEKAYKIGRGVLYGGESIQYDLRIWIDEETTMADGASNKEFVGKVSVVASYSNEKYQEEILNGMDPVLKEGLVPVTISDDGVVQKANLYSEWYSYGNQKWANAVILEDESITYEEGEEIPESNIESYFVWIPRYKYKIFNLGNYTSLTSLDNNAVQTIDIVFGDTVTNDLNEGECTTPMTSGATGNCKVGDYMSHPAFLAFDVKGLWVGKFETGYKDAVSTTGAEKNENNPDKIQIKANVYSWRNINIANAHLSSYNYKREYDSHMMKNTEWGAVAYLQHSIYGSRSSVRINNNSNYITGYASKNEPTCGYTADNRSCNKYEGTTLGEDGAYTYNYKNPLSVVASTTNNYSGVYDMNGGLWDYVMGVMTNSNGVPCAGNDSSRTSGFAGPYCNATGSASGVPFPEEKYYDKYLYSTSATTFNRRILGDATGEMGPFASTTYGSNTRNVGSWYEDEVWFVYSQEPWFAAGGHWKHGVGSGIFSYYYTPGILSPGCGFRIVLAF